MRGVRVADVIIGGWLGGLGWTGSSMFAVRQVASCDARCAVRRDKESESRQEGLESGDWLSKDEIIWSVDRK